MGENRVDKKERKRKVLPALTIRLGRNLSDSDLKSDHFHNAVRYCELFAR